MRIVSIRLDFFDPVFPSSTLHRTPGNDPEHGWELTPSDVGVYATKGRTVLYPWPQIQAVEIELTEGEDARQLPPLVSPPRAGRRPAANEVAS